MTMGWEEGMWTFLGTGVEMVLTKVVERNENKRQPSQRQRKAESPRREHAYWSEERALSGRGSSGWVVFPEATVFNAM